MSKTRKSRLSVLALALFLSGCTLLSGGSSGADVASVAEAKARVETLAKTEKTWAGDPLPSYPSGRPEITILRIVIPAKSTLPLHKHPVINAGVLLKGELTVFTEDGETLRMKAGDSIVEVVDKWHYGKNEGDEPAEIIVFYAGSRGMPITVKRNREKEGE